MSSKNDTELDFAVKIQMKNNHLFRRRIENGWTLNDASKFSGVKIWPDYENFRRSPVGENGWKQSAIDLANFLCVEPEELWPEAVLAVKKNVVMTYLSLEQVHAMSCFPTPAQLIDNKTTNQKINDRLSELKPRNRKIVECYFGLNGLENQTIEEIAHDHKITRERIRQIISSSLRFLRWHFTRESTFKELGWK